MQRKTVKLGDVVATEFGEGQIVAMSHEWCIVRTSPQAKEGDREAAVQWDAVWIVPAPESAASSIAEREVPVAEAESD